jgi:mono/diheme cytochrome c family protein
MGLLNLRAARVVLWVVAGAAAACATRAQEAPTGVLRHGPKAAPVSVLSQRTAIDDLEVTGMLAGVPQGAVRYASYADLLRLPSVTAAVTDDADIGASAVHPVRVAGVPLDILAKALGVLPTSDLIDALCSDRYRSQFPADYIAAHRPILVLTVNGLKPAAWAVRVHKEDPGPYFIVYDRYVPTFKVLSHSDEEQLPTNVVRLNFTTRAATFGGITPRGEYAADSAVMQGFAIAKQNCMRCHASGAAGGTKSKHDWAKLSAFARQRGADFEQYVHDPPSVDPHAKMPRNAQYDAATLAALRAYFSSLVQ